MNKKTINHIVTWVCIILTMVIIGQFCIEERSWFARWWISLSGISIGWAIMFVIASIIGNIGLAGSFGGIKLIWWLWGSATGIAGGAFFGLSINMLVHPEYYKWNIGLIFIILTIGLTTSFFLNKEINKKLVTR